MRKELIHFEMGVNESQFAQTENLTFLDAPSMERRLTPLEMLTPIAGFPVIMHEPMTNLKLSERSHSSR